jgi:hypothetical protein
MVKLVILLLTGLSNKLEPSMVFDPSEFEAPRNNVSIEGLDILV